ncbi:MAG: fimbrillin family protein, partial [Candidatus Cryptobacteroides sp.]
VTNDNFTSFKVTAIGKNAIYFDDVAFIKNDATTYWESDTKYFWPAFALDFYAYNTPANGTFTPTVNTSTHTLSFTPSEDLAKQEDLVVAKALGETEPAAATDLTFNHYLTQVIVKAKNSSSTYKVVVDGVKLANFQKTGTYTFETEKMVAEGDKINYDEYLTTPKELTTSAQEVMTDGENGKWYLVPQTVTAWDQANELTNASKGTYLALKVKITANSGALKIYPATGDESSWMAIPISHEKIPFAQGHKYTITVNFFSTDAGATSGGAGYVDPEDPGDLNGDNIKTDDAGKKIIGGVIRFSADVVDWSTNSHEITIDL